jgi:hypothetical protein
VSSLAGRPLVFLLFDRKRLVDELLTVRHSLGKSRVGALFGHVEPDLIIGVAKSHDLHLVIFERLDRVLVNLVSLAFIIDLRLLAGLEDGVPLCLVASAPVHA